MQWLLAVPLANASDDSGGGPVVFLLLNDFFKGDDETPDIRSNRWPNGCGLLSFIQSNLHLQHYQRSDGGRKFQCSSGLTARNMLSDRNMVSSVKYQIHTLISCCPRMTRSEESLRRRYE